MLSSRAKRSDVEGPAELALSLFNGIFDFVPLRFTPLRMTQPSMSATTKHFIIATAGHVDHGKSALVKALTGTDPDRLPEEKKRQITIDLGFAELNLTGRTATKFTLA